MPINYSTFNFCFQIHLAPLQDGEESGGGGGGGAGGSGGAGGGGGGGVRPTRRRRPLTGVPRTARGRAVQVDPIKPELKAPRIQRSKLQCDEPLSNSAFKFNLRRYSEGPTPPAAPRRAPPRRRPARSGPSTRSTRGVWGSVCSARGGAGCLLCLPHSDEFRVPMRHSEQCYVRTRQPASNTRFNI